MFNQNYFKLFKLYKELPFLRMCFINSYINSVAKRMSDAECFMFKNVIMVHFFYVIFSNCRNEHIILMDEWFGYSLEEPKGGVSIALKTPNVPKTWISLRSQSACNAMNAFRLQPQTPNKPSGLRQTQSKIPDHQVSAYWSEPQLKKENWVF